MSSPWMQFLPELLGQSRTFTLANGEHMVMNQRNFKLLFETGNLSSASPAWMLNCVSCMQMVSFKVTIIINTLCACAGVK